MWILSALSEAMSSSFSRTDEDCVFGLLLLSDFQQRNSPMVSVCLFVCACEFFVAIDEVLIVSLL